ncbi:hypothetical protein SISSUDRAFT_1056891 [Sistotremastrum suecicum HHB10207 ss-3]|uniref:Uncharacterized protein n=1 Tax=Sistotremastrum suecicum HHB10207 ss-3 TaxID=1314776 RepID=A0A166JAZ9_9AGAM|nr:hypothetical protein SISSUDRAFT_1056891 [Sistotremastrum suecicum HHB10207 ss-3]
MRHNVQGPVDFSHDIHSTHSEPKHCGRLGNLLPVISYGVGDDAREKSQHTCHANADNLITSSENLTEEPEHSRVVSERDEPPGLASHTSDSSIPAMPQTRSGLYQHLIYLLHASPPTHIKTLVQYHAAYPHLQSTRTYNLLIQHAIRLNHDRLVVSLSRDLRTARLSPNLETQKLWIRFHVRRGQWDGAWDCLLDGRHRDLTHVPLILWAEFLGRPRDKHLRDSLSFKEKSTLSHFGPLGHDLHTLSRDSVKSVLRLIRSAVVRFADAGHLDMAIQMLRDVLRKSPQPISSDLCCAIIPAIDLLLSRAPQNTVCHLKLCNALDEFLAISPALQYNAGTLHALLRTLSTTKNPGWRGIRLTQAWLKRWGVRIVDSDVRYRIAKFAMKEGRLDIVQAMLVREFAHWKAIQSEDPNVSTPRVARFPRKMTDIYPREGKNRIRWRILQVELRKRFLRSQPLSELDHQNARPSRPTISRGLRRLLRDFDIPQDSSGRQVEPIAITVSSEVVEINHDHV